MAKFLSMNFCTNDYIEGMATFTALVKIEYFCNTKVAGLGEIFVQRKFSAIQYMCSPVKRVSIVGDYDVWFDVQDVVKELPQ